MPMMLASCTPAEVRTLRAARAIQERLLEEMARHDAESGGDSGVAYRQILADRLSHEIVREREFRSDLSRIIGEIGRGSVRNVASLHEEGRRLVFSHYSLRHSPPILHDAMTRIHRAILERCAVLAGCSPGGDWALLAAGALGRGEETCCSRIIPVLVTREPCPSLERFIPLLLESGLEPDMTIIQEGEWNPAGLEGWERTVASLSARAGDRMSHLADLSPVCGDHALTADLLRIARAGLTRWRSGGSFPLVARQTGSMRLAIGFFGGFRVERSGPYRGSIDLDGEALDPLVAAVRLLAIAADIETRGTVDRVRRLLSDRWLQVEPAGQIVDAFHALSFIRGKMYGANGCLEGEHRYIHPEELSHAEQELLRAALETTLSLQRLMILTVAGRR